MTLIPNGPKTPPGSPNRSLKRKSPDRQSGNKTKKNSPSNSDKENVNLQSKTVSNSNSTVLNQSISKLSLTGFENPAKTTLLESRQYVSSSE